MRKILVVSDNEFLNLLYVLNLEVYLNTSTMLVHSVVSAIETLKKEKFDCILTVGMINREDAGAAIHGFLKSYGKKIPLIITGSNQDEVLGDAVFKIEGKFNIQNILKTSARILNITAKQMAELNVGAYYPISIEPLLGITKAPCHIYPDATSHKLLVRQDDPMDEIIYGLAKDGVQHVYVSSGDRLLITNKISVAIVEKITATLNSLKEEPVEMKVQVLSDGFGFAAANLFSSDEIKQQMQEIATASAHVMQDVVKDCPHLKSLLAIMASNRDGYIFTHSMITSYVAYHMIKNATWGGEGQVEKINFVLFFHDIFLAPIYLKHPELKFESELLENETLDDKEKDIILDHAKLAAQLVVGYKRCPMGADTLIKQHHGMKKGKGFAKLYMDDLSPLSKVIMIAEMYVEEYIKAHDQKVPFNPKVAILKLVGEFKSQSYTKMVQTLINVPL